MNFAYPCNCKEPKPLFMQNGPTYCGRCNLEITCPAPDASHEEKSSNSIGALLKSGPNDSEDLTLLLTRSGIVNQLMENQADRLTAIEQSLMEQYKSIQFLAQQVKTLVDALAEEMEDPDRPITSYMSGKPV